MPQAPDRTPSLPIRVHPCPSTVLKLARFVLTLSLIGSPLRAADIYVFAAASLKESLTEIGAACERTTSDKIIFNFGASSTLARQIEEGAPCDLFLSADQAKVKALESKDLLAPGTRRNLLSNTLVIVVPLDATSHLISAASLAEPGVRKIALAETTTVPAGIYARRYLETQRLWDRVKDKVIPTENVRTALAAVESGNVDAAIVYRTDSLISKKTRVAVEIPPDAGPSISYSMVILRSSRNPASTEKLARHLSSDEATAIFRNHGFTTAHQPLTDANER